MSFKEILTETTRNTLTQILGEMPTQTLLTALESKFSIRQGEIPDRLAEFYRAIVQLLGPCGRIILELILKSVYAELGLTYSMRLRSEQDFILVAEKARRFLSGQSTDENPTRFSWGGGRRSRMSDLNTWSNSKSQDSL